MGNHGQKSTATDDQSSRPPSAEQPTSNNVTDTAEATKDLDSDTATADNDVSERRKPGAATGSDS